MTKKVSIGHALTGDIERAGRSRDVSSGMIPRNRLKWVPPSVRLAHEYCFFLHDTCVHMLAEYEKARAHLVRFKFRDADEANGFERLSSAVGSIEALKQLGRLEEAKRVAINTITIGMVSDCLHHIYEALRCMERRKVVVAFNLFRKPLLDNLVYLAWMLGDEDGFYEAFANQSPAGLAPKIVGNRRQAILQAALEKTALKNALESDWLHSVLFKDSYERGLYKILQRAVHLITVDREAVRTEPMNFNFIFKNHTEDDSYEGLYEVLPTVLLFLSHVILGLYDRMKSMDPGARSAFEVRTILGMYTLGDDPARVNEVKRIIDPLATLLACPQCGMKPAMTKHNLARLLMRESFRCTGCRVVTPFPLSYLFNS
jgi:hypothetical protein